MALAGGASADAPARGQRGRARRSARRAGEMRDHLRFLLAASDPRYVYFLETRGRGVFLRAAPIDVSRHRPASMLFDRMRATVLTSATLAVDGSFDYVRGRLGVDDADGDARAVGVRLRRAGHALPAAAHAAAQVAATSPTPSAREVRRDPAAHRAAARSCCSPATRCCARCTSWSSRTLPYPVLVQGTAPRSVLLEQFRTHAERRAVRDLVLLAGRGRGRRAAELRDHRQAAVRLAGRSDHRGAHRGDHRRGRRRVRRLPGAAGDPGAAAGPGPADPPSRPTAACWRCSIRGCGRWATAGGSSTRSRRRPITHDLARSRDFSTTDVILGRHEPGCVHWR